MALIKCTECGQMISERAEACPKCGCPIEEISGAKKNKKDSSQSNKHKCEECGKVFDKGLSECPNCGCPVEQTDNELQKKADSSVVYAYEIEEEPKKSRTWLWFVVIIASISLLCVGVNYLLNGNGSKSTDAEAAKDENKPQMTMILYNDDSGEIRDENNMRISGFKIYGRSGTITAYLNTSISFFGKTTEKIYLHEGKAYTSFDDYCYHEDTTGTPFKKEEVGTEIHFLFYSPNGGNAKVVEKSVDQKIREAKTVAEVRRLIDGTTWHYTEDLSYSKIGCWLKVVFRGGQYTCYYAKPSDGKWTKSKSGTYKIEEGRYSNTGEKYISVKWDGDIFAEFMAVPCEFEMTTDNFTVHVFSSFTDHMNTALHGHYYTATRGRTHGSGQMEFGDYTWNN